MSGVSNLYSVHLSTAHSWRGGENQLWLLARVLQARGQRVLVVAPPGTPLALRCQETGVPLHALPLRGEIDPLAACRLMALLRRERPGILHLHDGHAVLHGQLAGRVLPRSALKVIAHRRTVFALKGRWKYGGRVDRIIAISQAARETLIAGGLSGANVHVVYSGLEFAPPLARDDSAVLELRARCNLKDGELLLAHAAALSAEKRQCDIIQAVVLAGRKLKAQALPVVHLAIAGSGAEEKTLRARIQALGAGGWVHLLGFLTDLRPLWSASAAAVYASEAEGLCTALIEAQAAGLPAVITRAGGMSEVIVPEETGLPAEIGDAEGLAAAIVRMAKDSALRERMGLAAARRARECFSAEAMVAGIEAVYRGVRGI